MKRYLGNAFSLQMLDLSSTQTVQIQPVTVEFAAEFAKSAESCVGHPDTAAVISSQLGVDVPCQRANVSLRKKGDQLLVGQLTGGRLPEDTKTLPEGFTIQYVLVVISESWETSYGKGYYDAFCLCC